MTLRPAEQALDHLLIGSPDLASGVAWVAERLGVTPAPGGRHPGLGTHNALAGLGGARYLEVIAPDPDGAGLAAPFAWLARVTAPCLSTWCARADDLAALESALDAKGLGHSGIVEGSRQRPDGTLLEWRTLFPAQTGGGLVPFFIAWRDPTRHPSRTLGGSLHLEGLRAEHPEPESVKRALRCSGIDLEIATEGTPRLRATIRGSGGAIEF
ncbi:MAG TPA: VOC family protein [Thermoanaerobaculia bacterium]|nr:VOC family protein [Thermoanaerobaculia bacterium]